MSTGVRKTIYLRKRRDQDILHYTNQFKLDEFSYIARELMRDGIKYRKEKKAEKRRKREIIQSNTMYDNVTHQQPIQKQQADFSNVKLEQKEVSKDQLEERLDNF